MTRGSAALVLISILVSCHTKTIDGAPENREGHHTPEVAVFPEVNDELDGYLRNFERSNLPIVVKGCDADPTNLTEFNGQTFRKYADDNSFAYRRIPVNGDFVATITLGVADCFLPVLTTYKFTGDKIDEKTIGIGYCGSDCGYTCEEFMTIKNDYSIYVSDTIRSSQCDDSGNIIPGTTENYVIYKTGQLKDNGAIELSEEMKMVL